MYTEYPAQVNRKAGRLSFSLHGSNLQQVWNSHIKL